MKKYLFIIITIAIIFITCVKDDKEIIQYEKKNVNEIVETSNIQIETEDNIINDSLVENINRRKTEDNYDWIIEYDWLPRPIDGFWSENISWMTNAPIVKINKLDIPKDIDLYQVRLRYEYFYYMYTTIEKDILYSLDSSSSRDNFNIEFRNNYDLLSLTRNGYGYGGGYRVGNQINHDYPLVGIWGQLPSLTEYRLIDPSECIYYMEIDNRIPDLAIRYGTYLLKQIGDGIFETISSFPDGLLRLEFIDDYSILITPLFSLPDDEEGILSNMVMMYYPNLPRFSRDEY